MNVSGVDIDFRLAELAVGHNLPLYAVFSRDDEAVVARYVLNTDRRLSINTDDIVDSIEVYRGSHLRAIDKNAELYFTLKALVSLNVVSLIVYSQPELTFTLRRLGCTIVDLQNSGASGGSLITSGRHSVLMHKGRAQHASVKPREPYLLQTIKEGESFVYGVYKYSSIRDVDIVDILPSPEFPGILRGNRVEIDYDYLLKDDEAVSELFLSHAGTAWNGRRIQNIMMAGEFGRGRLGEAIRGLPRYADLSPLLVLGDQGGASTELQYVTHDFVSVDSETHGILNRIAPFSPNSYRSRTKMPASTSRWIGHLQMRHFIHVPKEFHDQLTRQLGVMDSAHTISYDEPPPSDATIKRGVKMTNRFGYTHTNALSPHCNQSTYKLVPSLYDFTNYDDLHPVDYEFADSYPRSVIHNGQRKLFVTEYLVIKEMRPKKVHYAGAAPGMHIQILAELFPSIEFVLYDPRKIEVSPRSNIVIHQKNFEPDMSAFNRNILLISDIRTSNNGVVTDQNVMEDMTLQAKWARYYDFSLLKFRLPFDVPTFKSISGHIMLQVNAPERSSECRLLHIKRLDGDCVYDCLEHQKKMMRFNDELRCGLYQHKAKEHKGYDLCYDCQFQLRNLPLKVIFALDRVFPLSRKRVDVFTTNGLKPTWICAFPGLGKTTLSDKDPRFADIDTGLIRQSMGLEKGDEKEFDIVKTSAMRAREQGLTILNNSPELFEYVTEQYSPIVVLPEESLYDDIIDRIKVRGNVDFASLLVLHIHEWVSDWEIRAKKHKIPVFRVKYLSDIIVPPTKEVELYGRAEYPDAEEQAAIDLSIGKSLTTVTCPSRRVPETGWIEDNRYIDNILSSYDFPVKARYYTGNGFRVIRVGSRVVELVSAHSAKLNLTGSIIAAMDADPHLMRHQLMMGFLIKGKFLEVTPKFNRQHVLALFSISNSRNHPDAWKSLVDRGNCTFCYPNGVLVRAFVRKKYQHRVKVEVDGKVMVTDTGSRKWRDHMINPNRVISYAQSRRVPLYAYTYEDFITVFASKNNTMMEGRYGPLYPQDPFMKSWTYFSTIPPDNYPWPDMINTQSWWVKIPTSTLREMLHQGSNDLRVYRALAMKQVGAKVVKDPETGYFYGIIGESVINVSGHVISMLLMAGKGVIDVRRYWDVVAAQLGQAMTKKKKNKLYTKLARSGKLTEDATANPFKIWHTYWDYYCAVITYIIMTNDLKMKFDPWVVRISIKSLNAMEDNYPTKTLIRRDLLDKFRRIAGDMVV